MLHAAFARSGIEATVIFVKHGTLDKELLREGEAAFMACLSGCDFVLQLFGVFNLSRGAWATGLHWNWYLAAPRAGDGVGGV